LPNGLLRNPAIKLYTVPIGLFTFTRYKLDRSMKNYLSVFLLTGLVLALAAPVAAQKRSSKKEDPPFASKLWYGAGVNIGFGSFNGQSQFGLGLSPMVGYKILEPISIGPRVAIFYTSTKFQGYKNLNLFDTEVGAFLRGRIFRGFFLQGELSNEWVQEADDIIGQEITKITYQRFNQYIGAGYNFGDGNWGSELGIFYNLAIANDINSFQQPWDYRFAITYRF
jgi:hypothetical protein